METSVDALVTENLKLVGLVLKRFKSHISHISDDYEDLRQIGYIGLIKAAKKFKPEFGFAFTTYATSMIEGEIRKYFRDERPVKVSRMLQNIYYRQLKLKNLCMDEDEICKELSVSKQKLNSAIAAMQPLYSVDEIIGIDKDNICFLDRMTSDNNTEDEVITKIEREDKFRLLKKCLSEVEMKVLELRLKNKTQAFISKDINCSQAQVSRHLKKIDKIIKKICDYYEGKTESLFLKSGAKFRETQKDEECEDMYEQQIQAIKSWLKANPGKPLSVSRILREAGLEIKAGLRTEWKRKAFKQLQEEGYAVEDGMLLGEKISEKVEINNYDKLPVLHFEPIKPRAVKLKQMAWLSEDNIKYEVQGDTLVGRLEDELGQVLNIKTKRLQQLIDELIAINEILGA